MIRTLAGAGGMLAAALAPVGPPALAAGSAADPGLTAAVERKFRHDPAVSLDRIAVATNAGIVHLTGTVDGTHAIVRAADLAREVVGVLAVDADLLVRPQGDSPEWGTAGR